MAKKRFALIGTGARSGMYIKALAGDRYKDVAELVALCDMNPGRIEYYNKLIGKEFNHAPVPAYSHLDFEKMIAETRPDTVIVTTIDRTHHIYACRAMELGCDVISEKPMTVDPEKCQQIIDVQKRTGKHFTMAFNYRYSPRNTRVKELLDSGICGELTSINFEWLLDTNHGADYFRRWHRDKRNSGGLMVHKATHHFDLVNWWINSKPKTVYAMGDLKFYGRDNAERRGVTEFYYRSKDRDVALDDPFALSVKNERAFFTEFYFENEKYDGYLRDRSVFSDGISIEDNMSVMVRYENKVVMNYTLCAHCPYEGYRICFNGTKGRLEYYVIESGVTQKWEDMSTFGNREDENERNRKDMAPEILFQPLWGKPEVFTYEEGDKSGHGGGDRKLLDNLFFGVKDDPFHHAADFRDGAYSILTGIGANISMVTGEAVEVQKLIDL